VSTLSPFRHTVTSKKLTLPTFFVIGAAKAGTTSLHHYLDQHPEVQMSRVKEPNYFSGPANGIPYPIGTTVSDRAEYEALFDSGYAVRGEASVGYSNHPRRGGVPERIRESVPDARFVYVVRDPVARTLSQYRYRVAMEGERRPIEEALTEEDPASVYHCPSRYATQLELYLREFPLERILVVDHAELLGERMAALGSIFEFLEVDPEVEEALFDEELNTGAENRAYPLGYVRLRKAIAGSPLRRLPRGMRRGLRGALERTTFSEVPEAEVPEALRGRLAELYEPEVARLRKLTGQSFSSWSL
jgi:Sulfotransferase family